MGHIGLSLYLLQKDVCFNFQQKKLFAKNKFFPLIYQTCSIQYSSVKSKRKKIYQDKSLHEIIIISRNTFLRFHNFFSTV